MRVEQEVQQCAQRGNVYGKDGCVGDGCVWLRVKVIAHNKVLRQRMASVHVCTHEDLL